MPLGLFSWGLQILFVRVTNRRSRPGPWFESPLFCSLLFFRSTLIVWHFSIDILKPIRFVFTLKHIPVLRIVYLVHFLSKYGQLVLQRTAMSWYPLSPLLLRRRYSFEEEAESPARSEHI